MSICYALMDFIASKQWRKVKVRLCRYERECLAIA